MVTLLEQSALLDFKSEVDDLVILNEIHFLITQFKQDKKDITDGKLRLYIPNTITKTAIEAFLAKNGAMPDLSFSKKIRTIPF